ncbi:Scr1 family TA system antitoxin-like transcriptional regulator [Streptomyces sp. NBC_00648]|uniref:Scr1 family TA system antitoxin-like transcriptional regulator n=1 Tax=Streptomyces sp. NBC_00648 TaxID=2975797 RepID=UPI003254A3DF
MAGGAAVGDRVGREFGYAERGCVGRVSPGGQVLGSAGTGEVSASARGGEESGPASDSGLRTPNVTLQVLPNTAGAHPGLNGPFTILGFADDDDPDVVLTENLTSSLYFEDKRELRRYQWAFNQLTAIAASPRASVTLLKKAAKELS